ncbi:MAG: helix-turn-helix domain-containing protein [Aeromicrobium sp.]|uniref:helix-turn-helix domain-containing protein n=1 Tax=Aeromicrobium sp. TaxID=1871063 RepID=UPI0039E5C544
MTDLLIDDAAALRHALAADGEEVTLRLSRSTAEWLSRVIDAKAQGQDVITTRGHDEVTPAEAAKLLGMSRPQVRKLMDEGRLPFRKVGSHHRVSVSAVNAFLDAERAQREVALAEFARVQNELGLFE